MIHRFVWILFGFYLDFIRNVYDVYMVFILKSILNRFKIDLNKYFQTDFKKNERDVCSGKSPKIDINTQQQSPKPYGKDAQTKKNVTLVYKCYPQFA